MVLEPLRLERSLGMSLGSIQTGHTVMGIVYTYFFGWVGVLQMVLRQWRGNVLLEEVLWELG